MSRLDDAPGDPGKRFVRPDGWIAVTGSPDDFDRSRGGARNARRLVLLVAGLAVAGTVGGVLAAMLIGAGDHGDRPHRHSPLAATRLLS
jgi:hypothetical protein